MNIVLNESKGKKMEILYSDFNKIVYEQRMNLIYSIIDLAEFSASRKQRSPNIAISGKELPRLNKTSAIGA